MAERIELKKRVYELKAGDIFLFSGYWRIVSRIDRDAGLVWYRQENSGNSGTEDSLMSKSQMLVAVWEK